MRVWKIKKIAWASLCHPLLKCLKKGIDFSERWRKDLLISFYLKMVITSWERQSLSHYEFTVGLTQNRIETSRVTLNLENLRNRKRLKHLGIGAEQIWHWSTNSRSWTWAVPLSRTWRRILDTMFSPLPGCGGGPHPRRYGCWSAVYLPLHEVVFQSYFITQWRTETWRGNFTG